MAQVPVGVSASPIDLARAYMSRRTTEEGQDLHNSISKSERAQPTNEFTRKPLSFLSPSPKPSICWPGSVVHTRHGLATPLGQRGRSRLQDFPRTPYSRTTLSKSKTKVDIITLPEYVITRVTHFNRALFVIQLQANSEYANTSTPFRQSRESPYEQVSLLL